MEPTGPLADQACGAAPGAEAARLRIEMAAEGWDSEDRITRSGWRDGPGYSIWFRRWDWHGQRSLLLIGGAATYHAHVADLGRVDEAVAIAAARARRAYADFVDAPPRQLADNSLAPDPVRRAP